MGTVYNNASLTLAASSTHSVIKGFLRSSVGLQSSTLPISIASENNASRTGKISICRQGIKQGILPLDKRGWSFQEFILSPRIIQFWNGDLIWTCCEDNMRRVDDLAFDYDMCLRPHDSDVDDLRRNIHGNRISNQEYHWPSIVSHYSGRKLSKENDRLNAIAGVARLLETKLGEEYVWGLWTTNIVMHLTWQIPEPLANRRPLDRSMAAPSWSWASVNSQVDYYRRNLIPDALSLGTDLSSNEPHGQHSRRLRLNARSVPKLKLVTDTRYTYYFHIDVESDDRIADAAIELLYLGIYRYFSGAAESTNPIEECAGLLIVKVEGDCYRRIGAFQMLGKGSDTYQVEEKWEVITRQQLVLI